jgi:hypothetical protein
VPAPTVVRELDASPSVRTDLALPESVTQVLQGEHTAVVRVEIGNETVSSAERGRTEEDR